MRGWYLALVAVLWISAIVHSHDEEPENANLSEGPENPDEEPDEGNPREFIYFSYPAQRKCHFR